MATTTSKLGLTKPTTSESADISVINSNMDIIDNAFGGLSSVATAGGKIDGGTDLNDVTAMGIYQTGSNSIAQSLSNCPTGTSFMMIVGRRSDNVLQILITSSANGLIFIRGRSSSGWGSWSKITGTALS